MLPILSIPKAGLFTSIQGLGNFSNIQLGMPIGGAMDKRAAQVANWLVGNPLDNPVLEITGGGITIDIHKACQIAFAGAVAKIRSEKQALPILQTLNIKEQCRIEVGNCQNGFRLYLALRGKWPPAPRSSQRLNNYCAINIQPQPLWIAPRQYHRPLLEHLPYTNQAIRVMKGPDYHLFTQKATTAFIEKAHTIGNNSNRMGLRLEMPLPIQSSTEIISSGVMPGTIQVTPTGQMIVLMADAQITGGYPRIAQVIGADMDRLGQIPPWQAIEFEFVSLKQAREAFEALPKRPLF